MRGENGRKEPVEGAPGGWLGRVALVRPGEGAALVWSASWVFLLMASYFILRPVRESFGVERGADDLPALITATLVVMTLSQPVFGWVVSRLPRRRFIPLVYRFFGLNLLAFFALFHALPDGAARLWLGYGFYVWLSVFNLFVVSVFWGFMADVWTPEQGRRLFGFIGVGATLGVIAGSWFTSALADDIGRVNLMLVSLVLLEASVWAMVGAARRFGVRAERGAKPDLSPGAMDGLRQVFASPYLLAISAYMLCFTVCSTFLYLKVGEVVSAEITDRNARVAYYADLRLWENVLTLLTQVFLTARIIRAVGVGPALTAVPLVTIAGFFVLGRAEAWGLPMLSTVFVFSVARGWTNYAVSKPSKEMLFSIVSRDEKYKAKPFIDTFVYRGGDALGAWAPRWLASAGVALWGGAAAVGAIGLGLGLALGLMRERRGRTVADGGSAPSEPLGV
ncbi:MAG TPA: MFS transporter [Phycisphaerales bacterium]|nr:MFS transporter [Phycisphaerales bacterium]